MKNKNKMSSMMKKIILSGDISIPKGCFITKFIVFIIYQGLPFGDFSLQIELVVFVYELSIY